MQADVEVVGGVERRSASNNSPPLSLLPEALRSRISSADLLTTESRRACGLLPLAVVMVSAAKYDDVFAGVLRAKLRAMGWEAIVLRVDRPGS